MNKINILYQLVKLNWMNKIDRKRYQGKSKKRYFWKWSKQSKLVGNSINYNQNKVLIKKGKFTSCKDNNNCPPWSIVSNKLFMIRKKRNTLQKCLDKFVQYACFYFPKFFIESNCWKTFWISVPKLKNSNNLGSSIGVPYLCNFR